MKRCSPPVAGDKVSGKSSDGPDGWPYFNLQTPGGGVILAVGWPGQWEATFTRDASAGLSVKAGQQLTHLCLKPGEEIRTPSDRAAVLAGRRRRASAEPLAPLVSRPRPAADRRQAAAADDPDSSGRLARNWPSVQAFLDAGIQLDLCWRDAGGAATPGIPVSPDGPFTEPKDMIWLNSGTWEIDTEKYPQGFKPFSDWVRAHGMQFLLWFEPERVGDPNSWLGKNHPEWLLPGNSAGAMLEPRQSRRASVAHRHINGMMNPRGSTGIART